MESRNAFEYFLEMNVLYFQQ